ncbi:MAG: hypothetical protein WC373_05660 [Smithella sp.]|jgi:hypothetical protein
MAINKEKSVQVWAVLDKESYALLKDIAAAEERSISKQSAYIIKEYIRQRAKKK